MMAPFLNRNVIFLRDDKIEFKGLVNLRVKIHQCLILEIMCLDNSFENTGEFLVPALPGHVC